MKKRMMSLISLALVGAMILPNAVIVEGFAPEKETEDSELEIDGIS